MAPTTRRASRELGGLHPPEPTTSPSNINTAPNGRKRKAQDDGGRSQKLPLHPATPVDKALARGKLIVAGWTTIQRNQPFVNAYKSAVKEEPGSNLGRRVKRAPTRNARPSLIKAILHACYLDPKESPIDPNKIESDDVEGAQVALQVATKLGNAQYEDLTPFEFRWYIKESRKTDPHFQDPRKESVAIRALLAMLLPAPVPGDSTRARLSPKGNITHNIEATTVPSGLQRLPIEVHTMILSHLPSLRDVHNATKATAVFRNAFPYEAGSIVPRLVYESFWGIAASPDDAIPFSHMSPAAGMQGDQEQLEESERECVVQYGIAKLATMAEDFPAHSSPEEKQQQVPRLQRTPRARMILTLATLVISYVDAAISAHLEAIVAFHGAARRESQRHHLLQRLCEDGMTGHLPWVRGVQKQPDELIPFSDLHSVEQHFMHAVEGWSNIADELRSSDACVDFIGDLHQALTDRRRALYFDLYGVPRDAPASDLYEAVTRQARSRTSCVYAHSGLRVSVTWADVSRESFTRHMLHPSLQLQSDNAHHDNEQGQSYQAHLAATCSTLREHHLSVIDDVHAWALEKLSTKDRLILNAYMDRQELEQAGPVKLEIKTIKVWDTFSSVPPR